MRFSKKAGRSRFRRLAAVSLVPFLAAAAWSGESHAQQQGGERQQRDPLEDPFGMVVDVEGLPRVLLIGDSISIGYTVEVRRQLAGVANVHRPPENCASTLEGLEKIGGWLGAGTWDVIHFNWGLHDLKFLGPNGENLAAPESEGAHRKVPLDDYEANLRRLVERLKQTGARLIWRNTTPVPEGAKGRIPGDVERYNAAASRVMNDAGIPTQDLNAFAAERLSAIQRPKDVHFTADGSKALAGQVAETIRKALEE